MLKQKVYLMAGRQQQMSTVFYSGQVTGHFRWLICIVIDEKQMQHNILAAAQPLLHANKQRHFITKNSIITKCIIIHNAVST